MQRDVESYKFDTERLMKSKDKQYEFNIKLLQSMERIEKLDKETKSIKSRSHRSHAIRWEYGRVDRNHDHSRRHSVRRG
jgi:hypothetical protein